MSESSDNPRRWISTEIRQPISASAVALVESIVSRHGRTVAAVLFYGSCMRRPDPLADEDPVFDFYVVVDRYRDVYRNSPLMLANWLLPPNVFYLEVPWHDRVLRAKYAIVSMRQLRRRAGPAGFHPYFWARLSQPTRLAFVRNDDARAAVIDILVQSATTLMGQSIGLMPERFMSRTLWTRAYSETYRTELRAEGPDRSTLIYESDPVRYDAVAEQFLAELGVQAGRGTSGLEFTLQPGRGRMRRTRMIWMARRLMGKPLSLLRLVKGAVTFDGGVRYILWKIERHSGVKANMSAWEQRHLVLSAPAVAWRLFRQGAFR